MAVVAGAPQPEEEEDAAGPFVGYSAFTGYPISTYNYGFPYSPSMYRVPFLPSVYLNGGRLITKRDADPLFWGWGRGFGRSRRR